MPNRRLRDQQDCEDFVRGCRFMGTGGGGGYEWGVERLTSALEEGCAIGWVDPSQIPDPAWTCSCYAVGSIAPSPPDAQIRIEEMGLVDQWGERTQEIAVSELEKHAGVEISAIVPTELGAGNTPSPLVTGARLGIPVVDGDYAGRAVPEELQGTPCLYGKSIHPLVGVDRWGDVVILSQASALPMVERIGKMLAEAAFGTFTLASTLLRGSEMKQILVPGTLTRCLELGRAIRQAREKGADPVRAAIERTRGWLLFEGEVVRKDWEDRNGYMSGTTRIQGTGACAGHTFEIWFRNENQVSWLDGFPYVCSPDLLVVADQESGEGITNTCLEAGQNVAVVGIRGLEAFRSEKGLAAAGPRHFGFDVEYVPIEQWMEKAADTRNPPPTDPAL